MGIRKKWIDKTALLCMLAFTLTACKGKEAEPSQSTGGDVVQQSSESLTVSEEGSSEEGTMEEAAGAYESVMDVICGASGIVLEKEGVLLVTDTYNKVIWQVKLSDGECSVYAGGETVADLYGEPVGGYNDATLETSYFRSPWAIAPFLDGYAVSDSENNAIRLISKEKVQTVNGSTTERLVIKNMGVVFDNPTGLAADEEGNLYVSDTSKGAVRRISSEGKVTTVAKDLEDPMGLCWKDGVLYIAETGQNRIVKLQSGKLEAVAGSGVTGYVDGSVEEAVFASPQAIAVADDGTIYVSDTGNSAVRKIKDGQVTTLLARDRTSLINSPVSPVGLLAVGQDLYICDNFARKVIRVDR